MSVWHTNERQFFLDGGELVRGKPIYTNITISHDGKIAMKFYSTRLIAFAFVYLFSFGGS
jgi:hypothetical protein